MIVQNRGRPAKGAFARAVLKIAVVCATVGLGASPSRAFASAAADSVSVVPPGQSLRGTEQPLQRRASPVRYAGRAILFVPYAGIMVVAWPTEKLIEVSERWKLNQRLSRLMVWGGKGGQVRLAFGYESSLGLSIAGVEATSRDFIHEGATLRLDLAYLNKDKYLAQIYYRSPESMLQLETFARFERKEDRPFFGVGPDSPNIKYATNRQRVVGEASMYLRPWKSAYVVLTGYGRAQDLSDPGSGLSVRDGFPLLFSQAETSEYVGGELDLVIDKRNNGIYSTSGAFLRLLGGYNEALEDTDESYSHFAAEFQGFVNLYRHTRSLFFRAFVAGIDADNLARVPYTEWERVGGKTGGRGYARYRFADRSQLLLTGAYRYRVTGVVQGVLFSDWGVVARDVEDLRLADLDPSVGIAIAAGVTQTRFRAHAAYSEEGWEFFVGNEVLLVFKSRRLR